MIKYSIVINIVLLFAINTMAEYKVEQVNSPLTTLGEGPHYDIESESLYYNDIYGGSIHRYDLAENKTYSATVENEAVVSFIIPVYGTVNEFAIGIGRRIGICNWDGKSKKVQVNRIVGEVENENIYKTNRFNDAKADPNGRFYGGTMRLEECGDIFEKRMGSLYKHTKENGFEKIRENVGVSNGLTWNEKMKKMYFIDSCDLDVKEFDYDSKTGNISNERVVIDFKDGDKRPNFVPDGMTIDADGYLYVALWGGFKVLKVNPTTGKIELEINIPCEQVTSAAFGGPNLDILFVTTAGTEVNKPQSPPAGALFKVTGLGSKGLPMSKVHF